VAGAATAPILVAYFGQFSVVGMVANVVAIPLMALATYLGMVGFDEARQTLGAIESKAKGLLASGGDVQSDSISPDSIFRDDFEALKVIFDTK
jgi:hypothetical protein